MRGLLLNSVLFLLLPFSTTTPILQPDPDTGPAPTSPSATILAIAQVWLGMASESSIKADPSFAHTIFTRMDDNSLDLAELANFSATSLTLLTTFLGEDHEETLNMELDVALAAMKGAQYSAALSKLTFLLIKELRVLGRGHPVTLKTAGRLALCLWNLGRYEESLHWVTDTLVTELGLSNGSETGRTLSLRNTGVYATYGLGRLEEAWEENERLLNWTLMGSWDTLSLVARNNRAFLLSSRGQWEEARKAYEELWEVCRTQLGEEDEYSLTAKMGLARTLWRLGEGKKAISLGEEVLERRRRSRGLHKVMEELVGEEVKTWRKDEADLQRI